MKRVTEAIALVFAAVLVGMVGIIAFLQDPTIQPEEPLLKIEDKPLAITFAEQAKDSIETEVEEESEEYTDYYYYAPQSYSYYDPAYDDMTDQEYIAWRESGADYDARNGQYVGKYQLQEDMLAGDYSPENQEYMAEQYMLDRYGSWEAAREFWDSHGWW